MPGKIKVKVLAGRNLPVMDRASDTTDAFVEIKFGNVTHKTDVCRKSLNPHWSSTEWYRFEVDESELQDEPLQLRLMDHDTYSANDAIGKVVISLAPLLAREANNVKGTGPPGGAVLSGWIPVFDTMHGIRGELNVIVKIELFSDFNKYKTSSCGVQFFHCPMIPPGYRATSIHGFVEELVVNDDPEYQWIDKIRTPRASNEARQEAFIKLGNQVQRLVGLKAGELGANAVVGYQQEFDLEGEAGVVARAIGTAVSITPLPTPSQTVNTVSCSQQQLKKCLDILATDDESVTDLNQYYKTHKEELQKMINLLNPKGLSMLDTQENDNDDDEKVELVRQSSLNSYAGSASLYQDDYVSRNSLIHLSEDQTDLNRLLNRKDDDESDSSGPIQKIKKLKTNFFTKRFTKRKGHKKDEKQDDSISLKSNSSDTSRISLYDIKNEFHKLRRLKKPKFIKAVNKEDEGEGMASILARSVIHARTSLACIAETQDSQAENSPCSTMKRTSESEPNVHIDDDKSKISAERDEEIENKVPVIQLKNNSLEDLPNLEPKIRRISESCPSSPMPERGDNLLKLPGDKGYFGSVSSAQSGESSIYTSSEDDDESSDLKTDTDEFETTASIVKCVTRHETDPAFIAQMDRKLTVLQNTPPKISETVLEEFDKRAVQSMDVALDQIQASKGLEKSANVVECKIEKAGVIENVDQVVTEGITEPSTSTKDDKKCVSKPNTHYIKIHNPFACRKPSTSISCPSSPVEKHNFVYRSSKRIKDKFTKLSKSNMVKSISHISLFPKKKERTLSQPGSTSDVPSYPSKCPSETVLGSHFLSYSDLLELDKDRMQENKLCKSDEIGRSKFSMYIGSEPVSRCSISGPSHPNSRDEHDHRKERNSLKPMGLIHTAMETILIEKVESLLIPTSPEQTVNTKFFDDVSERLEEHKHSGDVMRQLQSTTGSITPRIVAVTPKRLSEDLTADIDKVFNKHLEETKGLVHAAMESKVTDIGQVILPNTDGIINESLFHEYLDTEKDKDMHRKKDSRGSISTLMDKVHFHPHFFHKKDGSSHDIRSGGLIHAAMQTMLIDRAQSMIPDTPEPIPIHTEPDFGQIGKHHKHHGKEKESKGLVQSALQTMLIDNVQTVFANSEKPIPIRIDDEDKSSQRSYETDKESTGLVHTALQTMLIENIQAVSPETNEPIPIEIADDDTKSQKSHGTEKQSTGMVHSALQTILIDNVQTVLSDSKEPIPIRIDNEDAQSQKCHVTDKGSTGLLHTALQTMLIENVQAVLPETIEPIPIKIEDDETKSRKNNDKEKESTGLIHTALQTMLIENIESVLPDSTEPIPIKINDDDTKSQTSHGKEKESTGLVHTALQTMLIENVQAVLPETDKPVPINVNDDDTTLHDSNKEECKGLVHTAMETILIDKMQCMFSKDTVELFIQNNDTELKSTSLVKNAMQTIDKVLEAKNNTSKINDDKSNAGLLGIAMKTMLDNNVQSVMATTKINENNQAHKAEQLQCTSDTEVKIRSKNIGTDLTKLIKDFKETDEAKEIAKNKEKEEQIKAFEERKKHLTRQDSVHSITSTKMSNEPNTHKNRALLQNFHPLLSGLETIPSVEDSFDRSIDDTNSAVNSASNISVESIDETNSNGLNAPLKDTIHDTKLSENNKASVNNDASNNSDNSKSIKPYAQTEDSDTFSSDKLSTDKSHRSGTETNASVCDNSHAACRFDRERERDRDRSEKGSPKHARHESYGGREPPPTQNSSLNASSTPMGIHRRSSDSDLSVTPKGGSLNTSVGNTVASGGAILRPSMNSNNLDMLEYPFLTMTEYPPGFIVHIGGAVCARSVKLVDGGGESAARAAWWTELRTELRAHARALRCNAVIAYRDTAAICEDVCVLSASGTAVVINLDCDFNADIDAAITVNGCSKPADENDDSCSIAHVPYSPGAGPYRAELSTCGECRRARVPAVLLAACAKPNNLNAYPKSVTLTAVAARIRRAPPTAEPGARDISDQLPFLEYELHKLLLAKLRMQGANALFSLQTQIAIGERCVMALASGTAVKLVALPPPTPPRIKASEKEKDAVEMQKALWDAFTANKAANGYDVVAGVHDPATHSLPECECEERPVLDLCSDKDACVLELDEAEDVETARALSKRRVHMPAFTNSALVATVAQPLAFTQVSRCRLVLSSGSGASAAAERQVSRALDGAAYKLRRMAPAALTAAFQLDLPEDEIQLVVSGTAIPLADPTKPDHSESHRSHSSHNGQSSHNNSQSSQTSQTSQTENDDIFELDEEQAKPAPIPEVEDKVPGVQVSSAVSLTTLSSVCGRSAVRLCALRLLFVRETTAVRELGGLSGFLHTFTCEVLAILRAYTAALGGNALTSFYITQLMLQDNAHKNQGQCLLSVGGDVVYVSY